MHLSRLVLLFLGSVLWHSASYSQAFFPDFQLANVQIISMINMEENGQLIIAKSEKKSHVDLIKIDAELKEQWRTSLYYHKLKSKQTPSKVRVLHNASKLFWINETDKIRVAVLDQNDGTILQKERILPGTESVLREIHHYTLKEDHLVLASSKKGTIELINTNPLTPSEKTRHSIPNEIHQRFKQIGFVKDETMYSYTYQVNRQHSKMEIELEAHDLNGKKLNQKKHELSLKHFSFAFNSSYDKNILHIYPVSDGFILFGKMDYRFNRRFVDQPNESRFAGFWIAKFDQKMDLIHKHEYPFSFFQNKVSQLEFPTENLIDLKEDANGNLFINFTTLPGGMLAQYSVIFYLNDELLFQSIHSGKLGRTFFDYNRYGVRNIAHKSNIRVLNDEWRYYSTNFLPHVKPIPHMHSTVLYTLNKMSKSVGVHEQDVSYNMVSFNEKYDYIFEYTKKKKSTRFRAYVVPKSMFKL